MKAKILFIDDEPQWLGSFKRLLEDDDYEVVTATNVAEALKAINATADLKVVLTDLMLPQGVGDEPEGSAGMRLLESVRLERPELPVIVVSGYLEPYAKDLGTLGAFAFISKGSRDSIEKIRFQIHKAVEDYESRVGKRPDDSSMLTTLRKELIDEINKYSPIKERTIYIPDEGPYELIKPLVGFKRDIEDQIARFSFSKNVFLMMKFRTSNKDLGEYIVENLSNHGLRCIRADHEDWNITKNVYNPIAVLYCCKYGIALFDEPEEQQAYSANVAYELGMMHYQNKHCLILRHKSLPVMPFDLIKDLYVTYERDLQVRQFIASWIKQVAIQP